jgi:glycosyltransferase involved in cell wall biosynthesis
LAGAQKVEFLARASALLYPVRDAEPFGLVLVEAMASGTPVIAFNRGGVPEILEHKLTGWLANNNEEFMAGIASLPLFDPVKISAEAHRRFSHTRMVDEMEVLLSALHKREG